MNIIIDELPISDIRYLQQFESTLIVWGRNLKVYIELDMENSDLEKLLLNFILHIGKDDTLRLEDLLLKLEYENNFSYSIVNEDITQPLNLDTDSKKESLNLGILHLSVVGKEILFSTVTRQVDGVFTNLYLTFEDGNAEQKEILMKYLTVDIDEITENNWNAEKFITVDDLTKQYALNIGGTVYAPITTVEIAKTL